ncbi:hypothetical protein, partial [Caenimonas koreensis]|uniref:hypothetical protein n=1 Tax=Caenimonas koreensis TaxID=367474 RepID=UPI001E60F4DA
MTTIAGSAREIYTGDCGIKLLPRGAQHFYPATDPNIWRFYPACSNLRDKTFRVESNRDGKNADTAYGSKTCASVGALARKRVALLSGKFADYITLCRIFFGLRFRSSLSVLSR